MYSINKLVNITFNQNYIYERTMATYSLHVFSHCGQRRYWWFVWDHHCFCCFGYFSLLKCKYQISASSQFISISHMCLSSVLCWPLPSFICQWFSSAGYWVDSYSLHVDIFYVRKLMCSATHEGILPPAFLSSYLSVVLSALECYSRFRGRNNFSSWGLKELEEVIDRTMPAPPPSCLFFPHYYHLSKK